MLCCWPFLIFKNLKMGWVVMWCELLLLPEIFCCYLILQSRCQRKDLGREQHSTTTGHHTTSCCHRCSLNFPSSTTKVYNSTMSSATPACLVWHRHSSLCAKLRRQQDAPLHSTYKRFQLNPMLALLSTITFLSNDALTFCTWRVERLWTHFLMRTWHL